MRSSASAAGLKCRPRCRNAIDMNAGRACESEICGTSPVALGQRCIGWSGSPSSGRLPFGDGAGGSWPLRPAAVHRSPWGRPRLVSALLEALSRGSESAVASGATHDSGCFLGRIRHHPGFCGPGRVDHDRRAVSTRFQPVLAGGGGAVTSGVRGLRRSHRRARGDPGGHAGPAAPGSVDRGRRRR